MESVALIAPGIINPYTDPQRTFSPSAIKNFLSCPLRFWMERLLRIAPGDALEEGKSEPDAAEYGTLLHAILQDITTRYNKADDETDLAALTEEITTYAEKAATMHVVRQYGDEEDKLPIPIRILLRNLQKSVQEFACQHAQELCNGWEVILCEEQMCFQLPTANGEAPLLFDMRVDRVDRHRVDGRMRVIDYKTNDSDPRATHWEKLSEAAAALYQQYMPAALTLQNEKGECFRWASVQLPLYAEALRQIHHLHIGIPGDSPFVRLLLRGQASQKCGFARAVTTYNA
jgi:ATP-dependent helicase/DNAse subunit B